MYSFESADSDTLIKSNFDYFLLYGVGSFGCGAYFGFLSSLFLILAPILSALLGFVVRAMAFEEDDKFSISFFNIIFLSIFVGLFFGIWVGSHSLYLESHWLSDVIFFSPFTYVIFYCIYDLIYSD